MDGVIRKQFRLVLIAVIFASVGFVFVGCNQSTDEIIGTNVGPVETPTSKPTPLQIKSVDPRVGAENVLANSSISVIFTEPVKKDTVANDDIDLHYINPEIYENDSKINFTWELVDQKRLKITPQNNLLQGEAVELVLSCDIDSLEDQKLKPENKSFVNNVCFTSYFLVSKN